MRVGDLVWCVHHVYTLPKQGIILRVVEDMDVFYEVLIGDEKYTLAAEEVFIRKSHALQYQVDLLRERRLSSKR